MNQGGCGKPREMCHPPSAQDKGSTDSNLRAATSFLYHSGSLPPEYLCSGQHPIVSSILGRFCQWR